MGLKLRFTLLAAVFGAVEAQSATLSVGPGRPFASPCAGVAAAQAGDTIEIDSSGAWLDEFCTLSKADLTIRSVGPGRARIGASGPLPEAAAGAMWVIAAPGVTIEGMEFHSAAGGAALRMEAGVGLQLKNCFIRGNEVGLVAGDSPAAEVWVENSDFGDNRAGHILVGRAARLVLQFNYIHHSGAVISRAGESYLLYNRITQENGEGAFEFGFPDGGRVLLMGNVIQRGPGVGSEAMLSYGSPDGGLELIHNTFVDERAESVFLSGPVAVVRNNIFDGSAGEIGGGNFRGDARFADKAHYDFRLRPDSPAINAGESLDGLPLPVYEYSHPVGGEERCMVGVVDSGAYEYGSAAGLPGAGSARTAKREAVLAGIEPRVAAAGTVALTLSSATAAAGATVTLNISMAATDTQPAGLQWTLGYSGADFTSVSMVASPAVTAAGKTIACAGSGGSYTCLVYGIDGNTIGNGVVAVATLQLAASPSGSTLPVQLNNGVSASLIGDEIATTTAGGAVTVQQPAVVTVTVSPATVTLTAAQMRQFTATVTGATNTAVNWSLTGVGTVSADGLYTTPGTISSSQTVTVQATSQADGSKSATATVTLQPTVAVSVSPATVTLTAGQTRQFTATVTGATNTAVNWSLTGAGTISAAGLYTAPATISSSQTVTVQATSQADSSRSATATVTLQPTVAVSVSPTTATLTAGQTRQFTATVTGATNAAVNWSLTGAGTVSAAGLYTAPATISSSQTVTVQATSQADGSKSASATVILQPVVTVSVSPTTATLTAGQTRQFTAAVTGATNLAVTWSLTGAGTIGPAGLYTAPLSIGSTQTVTVQATSQADSSKSATVTVTLQPTVAVSVSPATATLTAGQTRQFTATVTGATNTAVTWSLTGAGTITPAGLYTAPATISSSQTVTVRATSQADGSKSATATVTLQPTAVAISASPISSTLTAGQTQQFTATVTGTTNTAVTWSVIPAGVGTISTNGLYTAPAAIDSNEQVKVRATSQADTTKSATATVALRRKSRVR